jgi:cytoplasmic iron level regulating protein YaaA (DUF328/UPF0246 family)
MIIVLSPAKSLDYDTPAHVPSYTQPAFVDDASELIDGLRKLSPQDIATLMDISDPLARLNFQRYADWSPTFTPANAKQAVLAFNGDVYEGFDAKSLSAADLDYAQQHVRVLSGLYGCCGRSICCSRTGSKWAPVSRTHAARICMRSGATGSRAR